MGLCFLKFSDYSDFRYGHIYCLKFCIPCILNLQYSLIIDKLIWVFFKHINSGDFLEKKISYEDIIEYQHLFMLAPAFFLEIMAKKNSNLVIKFRQHVLSHFEKLTEHEKGRLEIILNSDIDDLQNLMDEAFEKSGIKQFKILANPKYKEFIELNIDELKKLLN